MPLDYKSKMVSFRLSEEQYEEFLRLCAAHGSASVSDMARTAITLMLDRPQPPNLQTIEARLAEVEERTRSIAADVDHLKSALPRDLRDSA
jgi:Arc/MetJ-type ribon-helix-helix transcriptional regulator